MTDAFRELPLPLTDAHNAVAHARGDRLFLARAGALCAVSLSRPAVLWTVEEARVPYLNAPRKLEVFRAPCWSDGAVVVHTFVSAGGVDVAAYSADGGAPRWRRTFELPAPLPWTERTPAYRDAPTEELRAYLLTVDALVFAIQRTSRRSMMSGEGAAIPPLNAQLELTRLDPGTGQTLWHAALPDVRLVSPAELEFDGAVRTIDDRLGEVDWESGALRMLASGRDYGWPKRLGGALWASWRGRGKVGVDVVGGRSAEWPRKGVTATQLHATGDFALLRVNDRILSAIHDDLSPGPEHKVKGYVYGTSPVGRDLGVVATAGGGGGLYLFDRAGTLARVTERSGGFWSARPLAGRDGAACAGEDVVAVVTPARTTLLEAPAVIDVAAVLPDRVAVLRRTGETSALRLLPLER